MVSTGSHGVRVGMRRIVERHDLGLVVALIAVPAKAGTRASVSLATPSTLSSPGLLRFVGQGNLHPIGPSDHTRIVLRRGRTVRPQGPLALVLHDLPPLCLHQTTPRPFHQNASHSLGGRRKVGAGTADANQDRVNGVELAMLILMWAGARPESIGMYRGIEVRFTSRQRQRMQQRRDQPPAPAAGKRAVRLLQP
jgi:hypothetical protein